MSLPPPLSRALARLSASSFLRSIVYLLLLLLLFSSTPLHAQSGSTFLPIITGAPGTPEPTPTPPPPGTESSLSLIEKAEASGAISHEQALLYSVLALHNDARLPAQFKGAPTDDSMIMARVREDWASLSATTQATLAPFLLPPNATGSWHERASAADANTADEITAVVWKNVASEHGVRIWYQTRFAGDDRKAEQLRDAIDNRIYTVLYDMMGKKWLPDGGLPNNGGDAMLDIYLVRGVGYRGLATPYSGCKQTAIWINVESNRPIGGETTAGILQTAAHEMLHAVQFVYPLREECWTYNWLAEATAKWFEHQVYPLAQSEHPYAQAYLKTTYWPLENTAGDREYGAYLYFFYVAEKDGSPTIVRRIWENAATMNSLKAVDEGGAAFSNHWGDFAVANWNPDANSLYRQWDDFGDRAVPHNPSVRAEPGSGVKAYPLTLPQLDHMSIQYFHFAFVNDNARAITFVNGITAAMTEKPDRLYADDIYYQGEILAAEQRRNIEVRALFRIAGDPEWKLQDWTLERNVAFCRDTLAERLEELVIIVANAEHDDDSPSYTFKPTGDGPALIVSDVGCWQWKGSLRVTSTADMWDHYLIEVPEIVLERTSGWAGAYRLFEVKSGRGTIDYRNEDEYLCGGSATYTEGPQPFSIEPNLVTSNSFIMTPLTIMGGPRWHAYTASITSLADVAQIYECDDDPEKPGRERHEQRGAVANLLRLPEWTSAEVKQFSNGGVMQGSSTMFGYTYTYNLRAMREGAP